MAVSDWTTDFENVPENTEAVSQGAERIRTFKDLTREIVAVDHYLVPADESSSAGQHNKVTLRAQDPIPIATSTNGVLYTAEVDYGSGDVQTELFYDNLDSATVQLTRSGSAESIPSGSKMYFYNNEAPDGWTFDNASNDRVLIGTDADTKGGVNLATGGAVTTTSWAIAGIDDTAISEAQMPAHTHDVTTNASTTNVGFEGGPSGPIPYAPAASPSFSADYVTAETGGDGGHTHTQDGSWRPLCSVVILCTKDAYT